MSTAINNYHATDGPKFKNKSEIRWAGKPAAVPAHDLIWKGALWRRALSHVIRAVRARHENAPLRMPQSFAHLFGVLILPPLLVAAIDLALSVWGVRGRAKKVPLGCMRRCANMNREKS